jgi:hypothetical protein
MIRHMAPVKACAGVTEAGLDANFADLAVIKGKVPGVLVIRLGCGERSEKSGRGCLDGFPVDVTTRAALQACQDHPDPTRAPPGRKLTHRAKVFRLADAAGLPAKRKPVERRMSALLTPIAIDQI